METQETSNSLPTPSVGEESKEQTQWFRNVGDFVVTPNRKGNGSTKKTYIGKFDVPKEYDGKSLGIINTGEVFVRENAGLSKERIAELSSEGAKYGLPSLGEGESAKEYISTLSEAKRLKNREDLVMKWTKKGQEAGLPAPNANTNLKEYGKKVGAAKALKIAQAKAKSLGL